STLTSLPRCRIVKRPGHACYSVWGWASPGAHDRPPGELRRCRHASVQPCRHAGRRAVSIRGAEEPAETVGFNPHGSTITPVYGEDEGASDHSARAPERPFPGAPASSSGPDHIAHLN